MGMKTFKYNLKRWSAIILGGFLVISGIIITPLPIPTGIIMIAVGLSILITHSQWVRAKIRDIRAKYQEFSQKLNSIKHKLPKFAKKMIEDTDPNKKRRFFRRKRPNNKSTQ